LERRDQVIHESIDAHFKSSLVRISERPPKVFIGAGRRIDIIEIVDQWYGPGYRYVKVRAPYGRQGIRR
jgi:hypothetical protein